LIAIAVLGLPTGRQAVFFWVFLGLLAVSITSPNAGVRDLIKDWLPFFIVLATYDQLRGVADDLFAAHTAPQLDFDKFLFFGHVPTVWLQAHFFNPDHLRPYDYLMATVYTSHFIVPVALAGVLWVRNRSRFRAYVARVIALSYAAFFTYVLFPAVPPWLAGVNGAIPPVIRTQKFVWGSVGLGSATSTLVQGQSRLVNNVAAVPSLHAAFPMLILLFFWPRARTAMRVFLVCYVLAMALALVYGAEHWVFDVLLGWGYAAAIHFGANRLSGWWQARKTEVDLSAIEVSERAAQSEPVTG